MSVNDVDKFTKEPTTSIAKEKKIATQVITFKGGYKATFKGIDTASIEQGRFTHFKLEDGRLILVNPDNVLCIEVMK